MAGFGRSTRYRERPGLGSARHGMTAIKVAPEFALVEPHARSVGSYAAGMRGLHSLRLDHT